MADRKLSMEELVPRTLRVRGALRSMMATFKHAAQEQRSADNDEADLAKGYGRTLDEALTLSTTSSRWISHRRCCGRWRKTECSPCLATTYSASFSSFCCEGRERLRSAWTSLTP